MTAHFEMILDAKEKCLKGTPLAKNEIVALLEIPLNSEADNFLRECANSVARTVTNNSAYIWSAIGADFAPCEMNCKFCSFGEKWGLVKNKRIYSEEEIINQARDFVNDGARFVVLRTTEFYSIEILLKLVVKLRREVLGDYEVILNVGEFDNITAERMFDVGVDGIYHALRLREGTDTPFDISIRQQTMQNVSLSSLKLISLVEPIGIEHSNAEIADNFLNIVKHNACISGAMARIPVKGTPLGNLPALSEDSLSHIIAVLRLSGGSIVKDICVHPFSKQAIQSGANVVVVEIGAIPRDDKQLDETWKGFSVNEATKLLHSCGYVVYNKSND